MKGASTKQKCNSFSYWLDLYADGAAERSYLVGIAPWTTGANCDTTASQDEMRDIITKWLPEVVNRKMTSYCVRFNTNSLSTEIMLYYAIIMR